MTGNPPETAIIITTEEDDHSTYDSSYSRPIIIGEPKVQYAYAYAVEVPPYPSIEEPAGTSKFNPILITVEEDLEDTELLG